jgi:8-oxo-dGTP pyrophosphatase MutT (NUDIX family)
MPVQRTAAYALVRDPAGQVLLVHASPRSDLSGHWFLPGGGLRHGESPVDAVRREVLEETGLRVPAESIRPIDASGDVIDLPHRGASLHTIRLIFEVAFPGEDQARSMRPEPDGTSDEVRFIRLSQAAGLPLMPFVALQLGLPQGPATVSVPERPAPLLDDAPAASSPGSHPVASVSARSVPTLTMPGGQPSSGPDEADDPAEPGTQAGEAVIRVQRPAAYAVLVSGNPNGNGRILLSKLAGTDLWTLPGGGIDHGEPPLDALAREVHEEAGLPYSRGPLLDISSRHFTGRAPSGRLEDFHGIRLLYAGSVPDQPGPHVIDVGGSSDAAAWFELRELSRVRTVATVRHALKLLRRAALNGKLDR